MILRVFTFLFILVTSYHLLAQVKLPNSVMYELIDCIDSKEALNNFKDSYLKFKTEDIQYRSLAFSTHERLEAHIEKIISHNDTTISHLLDTLRKYDIEQKDLIAETFECVYRKTKMVSKNGSGHNRFAFQRDSKIITVIFEELTFVKGFWKITQPITFEIRNSTEKEGKIAIFSKVPYDPVDYGLQVARLYKERNVNELTKRFPTEKALEENLKIEKENIKSNALLEAIQKESDEIRNQIYTMKPDSYEIYLDYMIWERRSTKKNEMDNGYYQFVLKYQGKESRFNLEFLVTENEMYLMNLDRH